MSTERIPLGFADLVVPAGSHLAYPYQSETARQDCLLGFVTAGLSSNEKCVAAVTEYGAGWWRDALHARGMDIHSLREGQFEILSAESLSPWRSADSPRGAQQVISGLVEASVKEGWGATRMCASFPHILQEPEAVPYFLKTEASMDEFLASQPVTVLCTFAAARLHRSLLDACLQCHQLVTDGASLAPNDDYLDTARLTARLPEILRELEVAGALTAPFASMHFSGDVAAIRTGDEVDVYTAPRVEELADWMISVGHRHLIVDLSRTTFMDAASISALVRIALALEQNGGRLAIYDPLEPPRKIFQLIKLHERIPIRRSLDEAVQSTRA